MARHVDHPTRPDVDLLSGAFWARDPHDVFTWMRHNAPVYFDSAREIWAVTTYRDVREISKNPAVFSNAESIRPDSAPVPMMIDMDDPDHWKRRKLVNRGFTPKRVNDQQARIRQVCDEIIDKVCERGECDFVWDVAAPLPLIMIGDALGFAPEDRETLLKWSDELLRGLTDLSAAGAIEKMMEVFLEYQEYALKVIADRREHPQDDVISQLVHAELDGDRLDDESLVHESLLILIGGDETTRHVLTGGTYQLIAHPDQTRKLVDDRSKIPTAVEEMLRWVSPIKNMNRTVRSETELRGQQFAEGDKVLLVYPSANRDEDVFPEPFRFDVERHPNEHIAFGFGSHFCLGNSLARLELQVMVERVLERLPDLRLADGVDGEGDLSWRASNFITGYERMPMVFTPTAPVGA